MIEYSDRSYPKIRWSPREYDTGNSWIYYSRRYGKPEIGLMPNSCSIGIRFGDVDDIAWFQKVADESKISKVRLLDFCEYAESMLCTMEMQSRLEGYKRPLFETRSESSRKIEELHESIKTFILMFDNLHSFAERYKVYTWYKRQLSTLKSEIKNFKGVQNGKEQAED